MKKHALRSVAALCLMLAVLVTAFCPAALAAEVSAEAQAARQEDLDYLYETLKSEHPNLFANTPEADFVARKAEIEARLSAESDLFFAFDCASLAALAKDSHTTVSLVRARRGTTAFTWTTTATVDFERVR